MQSVLAASNPSNALIQFRGQPSTHDLPLALSLFSDLQQGKVTKIPSYDKSAYSGQGERVPKEEVRTLWSICLLFSSRFGSRIISFVHFGVKPSCLIAGLGHTPNIMYILE